MKIHKSFFIVLLVIILFLILIINIPSVMAGCSNYQCYSGCRIKGYCCYGKTVYTYCLWEDKGSCSPCGTSCGDWSKYCSGEDVWEKRTCTKGGCLSGSCWKKDSTETRKSKDCESDSCGDWS